MECSKCGLIDAFDDNCSECKRELAIVNKFSDDEKKIQARAEKRLDQLEKDGVSVHRRQKKEE